MCRKKSCCVWNGERMLRSGCSDTRGCDFWEYCGGCFGLLCGDSWPTPSSSNLLHLSPIVALIKKLNVVHTFSPLARTGDNSGSVSHQSSLSLLTPHIQYLSHKSICRQPPLPPVYPFLHPNHHLSVHLLSCPIHLCWPALCLISAPLHECFVSPAWLSRLLRQHGVVLRVHHGSHSADLCSYRFSSSLTCTDMALWSHGEQRGPGTSPTKAIWSSADVSKHACGPPRQWTRTAGAPFATSVCTLEWTCMFIMGNWTSDEKLCCSRWIFIDISNKMLSPPIVVLSFTLACIITQSQRSVSHKVYALYYNSSSAFYLYHFVMFPWIWKCFILYNVHIGSYWENEYKLHIRFNPPLPTRVILYLTKPKTNQFTLIYFF